MLFSLDLIFQRQYRKNPPIKATLRNPGLHIAEAVTDLS